jgi:hypothetical protein
LNFLLKAGDITKQYTVMNHAHKYTVVSKLIVHKIPEILQWEIRYMVEALSLPIICISTGKKLIRIWFSKWIESYFARNIKQYSNNLFPDRLFRV